MPVHILEVFKLYPAREVDRLRYYRNCGATFLQIITKIDPLQREVAQGKAQCLRDLL
jgi:hypothetical protein